MAGNEPLLLGDRFGMRHVDAGSVALFCVATEDGEIVGPRQFLARFGAGDAVFSLPQLPDSSLQLMIVPIRQATVRDVDLREISADPRQGPDGDRLVEGWVRAMGQFVTGFGEPLTTIRRSGGGGVELADGEALQAEAGKVIWARVVHGTVRLMGGRDVQLTPNSGPFPLDDHLYVEADDACVASASGTDELETQALRAALETLHAVVMDQLGARYRKEAQGAVYRLHERSRAQAQSTREALMELASVVRPTAATSVQGSSLMQAMRIVGDAMGVEIRAPRSFEGAGVQGDPVEAIARASRLRLRRVTLRDRWWKWDCGALLAFSFDDGHPVGLIRSRKGFYEIVNPADGTRRRVDQASEPWLAPEAMMLYRPLPEGRLSLKDLMLFSISRRRRDLMRVLLTGLAATLLGMFGPQAMAVLLDHAIPDANQRLLFEIGAGLLAAAVGAVIFHIAQGLVLLRIGLASESESQAALWDRLLRLRPSFFRGYSSGDLQSRVMVVNEIGRELSTTTLSTLFSSVLAILNLALLVYYSPMLSVLALAMGLLVLAFTTTISLRMRKTLRKLVEVEGVFFGMVVQLINGVGKLRVAGAQDRAYTHWVRQFSGQLKMLNRVYQLQERNVVFNQVLPTLTSAVLFLISFEMLTQARAVGGEGLTLGTFMAFNVALTAFLMGVTGLSSACVKFMDILAKSKRVQPILEAEAEVDLTKSDPGELTGCIEMYDVEFSYEEDGPKILDGIHLHAERGEFIALVGPSGSGKSTIIRVLLGFETPQSGTISFNGQDLANLDVLAVRRQLGVVLQGGSLDAGSIFDNIASGNVITLEDAWAAAEDAGCADEIREMPMNMHTLVSVGGSNLSGGQRQRILIARALAHRPRILLFDEATSALDNRTQATVSSSLEKLNVTRLVVAHRLSTIRNADRIYVLERGRIVQSGDFEELMRDGEGLFARMMKRQIA